MSGRPTILVVDDEVRSLETLARVLGDDFNVLTADSAARAEQLMEREPVRAILCDQRMPETTGVEFLCAVRKRWPDPVRMILSGYTDAEDIIEGVNDAGIYRYITKPWDPPDLLNIVRSAVQLADLQRDTFNASVEMKQAVEPLRRELGKRKQALKSYFGFDNIIRHADSPMDDTCRLAARAAGYDVSVLITGESGTGKELLARAIHYNSGRADKPFVVENCGALPDELLESELFGCKKGAFTGAYEDRIGLFEQADGGTIFLDEIGETSAAFQVKLLRVLQEGEIRPLGGLQKRRVDVRVIAATNRHLEQEVREKRFREDLFYRLAAFPLPVPPLRERPMDIPLLSERLLKDITEAFGRQGLRLGEGVAARFHGYPWPGNVREMQNEIQRLVVLCDGPEIDAACLSRKLTGPNVSPCSPSGNDNGFGRGQLKDQVESLERRLLAESLARHSGNISRVAEDVGLSRVGLRNKLQRYGLGRGNGA
ncbi:sigma-54 dependent transcriptional regulator [Magnetospira thiophila]